jgi:hypothetical protein
VLGFITIKFGEKPEPWQKQRLQQRLSEWCVWLVSCLLQGIELFAVIDSLVLATPAFP